MKKYLIAIAILISGIGYGNTTIENPPKEKPKQIIVKATYAYVCTRGDRKLTYRLSYKDEDGKPPCRVYLTENGKRTVIGESMRTMTVCEKVLDKILQKVVEKDGMECTETK